MADKIIKPYKTVVAILVTTVFSLKNNFQVLSISRRSQRLEWG